MIVEKPINVKIERTAYRLKPGMSVPQPVIDFWNENNQTGELIKQGAISDDKKKEGKKVDSIRQTED